MKELKPKPKTKPVKKISCAEFMAFTSMLEPDATLEYKGATIRCPVSKVAKVLLELLEVK